MATATGYQGYQGYGSPERAKVERERRLAELLQQGVTDTGPKSLWEGVAQLGKAFIARDAMGRADKAEGEYGDSQRKIFEALTGHMVPDSAGTASVSQAPTPGDAKARLMAKANPEGTDPNAAMTAPQTGAAPAPAADPNAITKTDLPPISDAVVKATQWAAQQGLDPQLAAQDMQASAAPSPQAQPAPQMQPQAAPQAGVNPTARIAGALMAQPPMQKPPMQPQGQQGQASPENIRAVMMQYGQLTGDWAGALELGKSMQQQQYARDRDTMEDQRWDAQFGFQKDRAAVGDQQWGEQFGFTKDRAGVQDNQWGQQFGFQQDRAQVGDQQWSAEFGESKRQFDARMAADRAEAEAKTSGNAVFEGPQLATIYNRSMNEYEEAKARQDDLDIIANASQQFLDIVKDDPWLQGGGWGNDLMQLGSMKTSEAKSMTDKIAPLVRKPGSGGNSDNDIAMFKSSVVNVNNTPEGNRRAAEQARALQGRGQQYVQFLSQAIDPRDPQSKQKADALWNVYKNDQSLFGDDGSVMPGVMPFNEWLSANMKDIQVAPSGIPTGKRSGQIGDAPMAAAQAMMAGPQQNDTPPAGIDPEDWKYMSPADKAKFRR